MGEKKWGALFRLKKVLRKFTVLLRLHLARRLPSHRLRSSAFGDRTVRPRPVPPPQPLPPPPPPPPPPPSYGIIEYDVDDSRPPMTQSYEIVEDDVDERAQKFIDDFRSRLWLERQISRQLRYYYRSSSSETEYEDGSPPSPRSSIR
ncbi:ELL-associated factor 1-like [Momordica charantia]|uniref:ELL-associated factor 1-like n=1 Tax=Momordica charantia TaxID=3673 RepID=A0A6J1CVX6_MOMCH|nr:ELL-associated factor 1-like [Momordica charantia]